MKLWPHGNTVDTLAGTKGVTALIGFIRMAAQPSTLPVLPLDLLGAMPFNALRSVRTTTAREGIRSDSSHLN